MIAALALFEAGWMAFDGVRALVTGDYVTPRWRAGQLGPWSQVVSAVGIRPRSTAMKAIFAGYGLAWLVVTGFFLAGAEWGQWAMIAAAAGSLWFLPVGTLLSAMQLVLLLLFFRG